MTTGPEDTIAAIATAPGAGAVGIVRVSGPSAIAITEIGFRGSAPLADARGFTVHYGRLYDAAGEEVDEVLVTVFRSPHSYTGENAVEISCHGGDLQTSRVLQAILGLGARPAAPGEFTKRAFLNGRIDLAQAEAVAALVAARSQAAARASLEQLEGRLSHRVRAIRSGLLELAALLELELDFSEEGIELASAEQIAAKLAESQLSVRTLINSYKTGKVIRDGVSVAIVGKPNAGKSSLFNALLQADRAIVTHVPGTTRDSIEENIEIRGVLFKLTDTAGLRTSEDLVESEGIRRAYAAMQSAEVILVVHDLTAAGTSQQAPAAGPGQAIVEVWNKADLAPPAGLIDGRIRVSAKQGLGIPYLEEALLASAGLSNGSEIEGGAVTSRRHAECLAASDHALSRAEEAISSGLTGEIVALEVREATRLLGEIIGEVTSVEVLNSIFARFCIGK